MATPDEVLTIRTDVDTRSATQQFVKFQREVMRQLDRVTQAVEATGAANSKVSKKAQEDAEDWSKGLKDLGRYYQDETNKINALQKALNKAEKARQEGDESSRKAAERRAKALKKELDQHKKAFKDKAVTTTFDSSKMGNEATKALEGAADNFKSTISSFFSKDLKGVILGGGGLVKHLTKAAAKGLAAGGDKLVGMGTAMGRRGEAKGGKMGGMMQGLGSGLKELGGLGRTLGPVIGSLAKLGPVLGLVGAGIAGLVKLFIDADAQAKEFQKTVLQSASTTEYLAAAGGDAALAYDDLASDMESVRNAAHSLQNLSWGISAEQHKSVLNALTQEGVTLHSMRKEAELTSQSLGQFTAQLTHVSVAYSRSFGVSLQEINQFQAEMMTEMGASLDSTQLAFSQMSRSATESGIAANKFFSIIRGVSQDLSLYNVRMGSAIKLLGMLGKVMNPRNAQKFMQTAVQGLKQMGQDERLKVALLAGGKGQEIVKKDLENRRKNLYEDIAKAIGGEAEDVQKRLADPKRAKDLWAEVEEKAKDDLGALRESAIELQIDTKASKQGVYGQAFAMENLGAGATVDMMTAAIAKWGGGKSLMEGAGSLGMTKMAEMLGINTQQLRGMMKLEVAVNEQREALIAQAQTDEEKARLRNASTQDILDTMSDEEQKNLKEATKSQLDYAKEQGKMTQSLTEKLQVIVDFLMNELYNVLLGIWGSILKIPIIGDPEGQKRLENMKAVRSMKAGGAKEALMKAASSSQDFGKAFNETALAKAFRQAVGGYARPDEGVAKAKEEANKAVEAYAKSKGTPADKARLDAARKNLEEAEKKAKEKKAAGEAFRGKMVEQVRQDPALFGKLLERSKEDYNKPGSKKRQYVHMRAGGMSHEKAVQKAGFTEDDMRELLKGLEDAQGLDPKTLMSLMQSVTPDLQNMGLYSGEEAAETAKKTVEAATKTSEATDRTAEATEDFAKKGAHEGTLYFKMPRSVLNGEFKKVLGDAVLDSLRVALFEYYLYSGLDRESVVKTMAAEEMDIKEFAKTIGEIGESGQLPEDLFTNLEEGAGAKDKKPGATPAEPHQHGGLVSHISKEGMAIFRTPPGEGMTAIRAGERIVPAYAQGGGRGGGGGGGGAPTHVIVTVAPDAQKLIQTEVRYGINEHERRKRTGG